MVHKIAPPVSNNTLRDALISAESLTLQDPDAPRAPPLLYSATSGLAEADQKGPHPTGFLLSPGLSLRTQPLHLREAVALSVLRNGCVGLPSRRV